LTKLLKHQNDLPARFQPQHETRNDPKNAIKNNPEKKIKYLLDEKISLEHGLPCQSGGKPAGKGSIGDMLSRLRMELLP
jgi:hypothetical protein